MSYYPQVYLCRVASIEFAKRSFNTLQQLKLLDLHTLQIVNQSQPADVKQEQLASGAILTQVNLLLPHWLDYGRFINLVKEPVFAVIDEGVQHPLRVVGLDQPLTCRFDKRTTGPEAHHERLHLLAHSREGHTGYELSQEWLPTLLGQRPKLSAGADLRFSGAFGHEISLAGEWLSTVQRAFFAGELMPILSQSPTELVLQLPSGRPRKAVVKLHNQQGFAQTPFMISRY